MRHSGQYPSPRWRSRPHAAMIDRLLYYAQVAIKATSIVSKKRQKAGILSPAEYGYHDFLRNEAFDSRRYSSCPGDVGPILLRSANTPSSGTSRSMSPVTSR